MPHSGFNSCHVTSTSSFTACLLICVPWILMLSSSWRFLVHLLTHALITCMFSHASSNSVSSSSWRLWVSWSKDAGAPSTHLLMVAPNLDQRFLSWPLSFLDWPPSFQCGLTDIPRLPWLAATSVLIYCPSQSNNPIMSNDYEQGYKWHQFKLKKLACTVYVWTEVHRLASNCTTNSVDTLLPLMWPSYNVQPWADVMPNNGKIIYILEHNSKLWELLSSDIVPFTSCISYFLLYQ